MTENIRNIFKNKEEVPLFCSEIGSRLYGMENLDSDYDIRGFHLASQKDYFCFKNVTQNVIENQPGIEFLSFNIDYFFGLLQKSNISALEIIKSNNIYINDFPDWGYFKSEILKNLSFEKLYYQYKGLADKNLKSIRSIEKNNYKTLFFCIRNLLSAELAFDHRDFSYNNSEFFENFSAGNEMRKLAELCIDKKKQGLENQAVSVLNGIDAVTITSNYFEERLSRKPVATNTEEKLFPVLSEYSFKVKKLFY